MTKIPEGLYNKMFFLKMENGREALGRIPNPNAGHPQLVVASEVATLDFVSDDVSAAPFLSSRSQSTCAGLTFDVQITCSFTMFLISQCSEFSLRVPRHSPTPWMQSISSWKECRDSS
jgi:hypothetical protein